MIQLICDLTCCLFCVTVNGYAAVGIWLLYEKAVRRFGFWKQSILLFRILIMTILIPWQYIPLALYERYVMHGWWRIMPQLDIDIALSAIMLVWLIAAIQKGRKLRSSFLRAGEGLKDRKTADRETETCYRRIAAEMGIKHVPGLYITAGCEIPYLFHSVPAAVYLPDKPMEKSQLEVSLRHELTHYKHRDHIWAWLIRLCGTLQWWNPFMKQLEKKYAEWSEYANDNSVIMRTGDKKHYFETILNIIEDSDKEEIAFSHGLGTETDDDIEMRVNMFNRRRRTKKQHMGWIVNVLLALTLAVGVTVTLLVDNVASYAYYMVFQEASKFRDPVEEPHVFGYVKETERGFPEGMHVEIGEVIYSDENRSGRTFNWTIAGNSSVTSENFYLKQGQQVAVTIFSTNPAGVSVKFGLLRVSTNTRTSITGPAPVIYIFTAAASGYYKIFTENTRGTSITVYGFYTIM